LGACGESRRANAPHEATVHDGSEGKPGAARQTPVFEIRTYNTLPALLDEGRIGSFLDLAGLPRDPHLVGLGSLSHLRGEVLILRGETWLGLPAGGGATQGRALGADQQSAAFLVTASVQKWVQVPIPEAVPFMRLESIIEELADKADLDTSKPFPLILEGEFSNLAFNVVDGGSFEPGVRIQKSALEAAQVKLEYPVTQGMIVGFFADPPREEFIHPDARVHLHVLLPAEKQVGHVDRVDLNVGTVVHLPWNGEAATGAL
jgi:hypothetical protein